jgi:hypothetical protein
MTPKTHLKKLICVLLTLALLSGFAGFISPANAAYANEAAVYAFLKNTMGLNTAAACGILANIERESGFDPRCHGDGGTSYGLVQWHASRLTCLKNYCSANGLDYTTVEGQLSFLNYEMHNDFPTIYEYMLSIVNTADGAYEAGRYWCYKYEVPAYRSSVSVKRGNHARDNYWPTYHEAEVAEAAAAARAELAASGGTALSASASNNAILQTFNRLVQLIRLLLSIMPPKA